MSSLERAVAILRVLAHGEREGVRLQDVAERAGVARPTTHRLLNQMAALGLVDQASASERYLPGLDLFLLGQAVSERYDLIAMARPLLEGLAADTGDTIYLTVRHRHESVCLWRVEGPYPIKAFTTRPGTSQPLGLGAGSIALLAFLEAPEREDLLRHNRALLEQHQRFDMNRLLALIEQARVQGYVLRKSTVVDGITAIGVPVFDGRSRPAASISLTSIDARLEGERLDTVVAHCRRAAAQLQSLLTLPPPAGARA